MDYGHLFESLNKKDWVRRAKKVADKIFMAIEFLNWDKKLQQLLEKSQFKGQPITIMTPVTVKKCKKLLNSPEL